MSKGEFVWFFGQSAAGKRTAIERISADKNHPLRAHLGLETNVKIAGKSLADRGPSLDAEDLAKLHTPSTSVIIKVQWTEIEADIPSKLKEYVPSVSQRIVFLHADPREIVQRWDKRQGKQWKSRPPEHAESELRKMIRATRKFEERDKIPIVWIDSTDWNYDPLGWNDVKAKWDI